MKTLVLISVLFFVSVQALRLNEYIPHYETLSYNQAEVHNLHQRVRRGAPGVVPHDEVVYVRFQAHGKDFHLRLKHDVTTFSNNLVVEGPEGPLKVDTSHIYHGDLVDEPGSSVFGSLINGVFEGKIISSAGSFNVEKASQYFPNQKNQNFHSVIYNEDHIEDHYQHGNAVGCGMTDDISQWMNRIQNSAVDIDLPLIPVLNKHQKPKEEFKNNHEQSNDKYRKEENENEMPHNREKRARKRRQDWNTCSLYIQTDPLLWKHIREGFPEHKDPTKVSDVIEKTREEILSLIAQHVNALNYIYSYTKFDGRSKHRIKFEVQRIKIIDDSSCHCKDPTSCEIHQFCNKNINVTNFLKIHSLDNHEDFCLAYVFTYRDFSGGTLGLAWQASALGNAGGICEKYKTYTETSEGMYRSAKRSLNTGIITFSNYNNRVPPRVSQLALAHAVGHSFGSPHDYPSDCRPGGQLGNFVMFSSATNGDRPNNSKFSFCSIGNISAVLDSIEDNRKRNCFTISAGSFCGNKIIEEGEECDCGYDKEECNDQCCYPRIIDHEDRIANVSARGCTKRAQTECSPSEGPCCSRDICKFIPARKNITCKSESDCSFASTCNGQSAQCPMFKPKSSKTRCNNGTQLCIQGECYGSLCLEWNLQECFLSSNIIPNDTRKLCELACQNGTDPTTCRSTSDFAHLVGLPSGGISLRPGSPCDNFQGYCDEFQKCQPVDEGGPQKDPENSSKELTEPENKTEETDLSKS